MAHAGRKAKNTVFRRNPKTRPATVALTIVLVAAGAFAYGGAGKKGKRMLTVTQIRGALYQVSGGVGNAFFYVGDDETLVVDGTMSAETAGMLLEEVAKKSDKPIRRVVLTHSDGDHINGLAAFPKGLTIIAHPNCRSDVVKANADAETKQPLADITFEKALTLHVGSARVELLHFGPAHTSGDVILYFPAEKVALVGDLIMVGRDPLIHKHKQGSSFGLATVLEEVLKLDADTFASGHGDPVGREHVEEVLANLKETQAKVKDLIARGSDLAAVRKAFGIEDQPEQRWAPLAEIVFGEVGGE